MINRRDALKVFVASTSLGSLTYGADRNEEASEPSGLGLVIYCCQFRRKMLAEAKPPVNLFAPATFLDHCDSIGAGGMQIRLGVLTDNAATTIRKQAELQGKYIEAIVSVPKNEADTERFAAEIKTAAAVGALAVRTTIIPGRRYEFFESLEMFREYEARGRRALEIAAPIAEKYRVPLAVENHKDHRNVARVALFEHISSEYVGACVDTGNSFALLEDPVETAKALAPWAHSVHLKDQAVQMYDDGFLLADIPLGQGFIDLKKIVEILRAKKPDVRFSLELITRDPLEVPILKDSYWRTFPDLPAQDLASTLRTVRDHSNSALQYPSRLSSAQQIALEDSNVRASLDYARDALRI